MYNVVIFSVGRTSFKNIYRKKDLIITISVHSVLESLKRTKNTKHTLKKNITGSGSINVVSAKKCLTREKI